MAKRKWASVTALLAGSLILLNVLSSNAEVINRGIEASPYHKARPAPAFLQPDVNLLINNAGVAGTGGLFTSNSLDTVGWEMQTNYFGTLRMMQAFAPILKQNNGGAIINVLSIVAVVNVPVFASYSASKAALNSITQAARRTSLFRITAAVENA